MNEPVYQPAQAGGTMNKALKTILAVLVVLFIGAASFAGGFMTGRFVPALQQPSFPAQAATPSTELAHGGGWGAPRAIAEAAPRLRRRSESAVHLACAQWWMGRS